MKRGQTALEYLMTYGWALVVIVIVIAALYYFGVFSPPVASTCVGFTEFAYKDHALYAADQNYQIQLLGGAQEVSMTGVTIDSVRTNLAVPVSVGAGQDELLTFPAAGPAGNTIGDPYRGLQIILHFDVVNGLQNQSDTAQCSGSYQ